MISKNDIFGYLIGRKSQGFWGKASCWSCDLSAYWHAVHRIQCLRNSIMYPVGLSRGTRADVAIKWAFHMRATKVRLASLLGAACPLTWSLQKVVFLDTLLWPAPLKRDDIRISGTSFTWRPGGTVILIQHNIRGQVLSRTVFPNKHYGHQL